jgi:hypothetical protein
MSHQEPVTVVFWYSNDPIYHKLLDKPNVLKLITSNFGAHDGLAG